MDCSVEFTKSSRAVSIVIALLCDMPGETPNTVDDAPKPLPAICGAVKPWIPKRPSRTNLPVSAALLHTPTASLLPSGMSLYKHATCGPRMQVPIRTPHQFSTPCVTVEQHYRSLWRLRSHAGGRARRFEADVACPWWENIRPDVGGDSGGRFLNIRVTRIAHATALGGAPRDSTAVRNRAPVLPDRCPQARQPPEREDILCDISGHAYCGVFDGVSCEVCVSCGGLDLGVAEELGDHRQALAERQGAARVGVAQVVDADVVETGAGAHPAPGLEQAREPRARLRAWDHPGVAGEARYRGQNLRRLGRERDRARAGLAVAKKAYSRKLLCIKGYFFSCPVSAIKLKAASFVIQRSRAHPLRVGPQFGSAARNCSFEPGNRSACTSGEHAQPPVLLMQRSSPVYPASGLHGPNERLRQHRTAG